MQIVHLSDINLHDIGNSIQLVGAIFGNSEVIYYVPLPDDLDTFIVSSVLHKILDMNEIEWNVFLRQTDLCEVRNTAKAILRKANRQIDAIVQWKVFRRDNYACRYCGRNDVPLTVDHLILWEEGGPSTEDNLVSACKKCNRMRASHSYEEWLQRPYYIAMSGNLTNEQKKSNLDLIDTLANIKRVEHIRSR